jgi:hypothetical protein
MQRGVGRLCLFQVRLGVGLGLAFFGELGEPFASRIGDEGYVKRGCGRWDERVEG